MIKPEVWSYLKMRSEKFSMEILILCLVLLVYSAVITVALLRDTKGTMPSNTCSDDFTRVHEELKQCRQNRYNALFDYTPPQRSVVNE